MTSILVWLIALGPAALVAAALMQGTPRAAAAQSAAAAAFAFLVAAATAALTFVHGWLATPLVGAEGIGLSIRMDALNATVFVLVSFVGAIVARYSRAYMDGAPRQAYFVRWLSITLACVLTLIVSGNLAMLGAAWALTSIGLSRLLLFFPDRPAAILASRKKFLASRAGDLAMLAAMIVGWRAFGTLDIALMRDAAVTAAPAVATVAMLLAAAACLKTAQFPLHGWLTEVMETPTPVSALLHAGIINAGGFLVLRFADVIVASPAALHLLLVVGAVTALIGSVVMLAQTSVKVQLAWSTIAQMGFMTMQCGLGAFTSALLHIVAHSLYKAHAFLSSGSVMDLARASWSVSPGGRQHPARVAVVIVALFVLLGVVGVGLGFDPAERPGVFALGAIVLLGVAHLIANSLDERVSGYVAGRALLISIVVVGAYFGLQLGVDRLLGSAVPRTAPAGPFAVTLAALVVAAFALVTVLQNVAAGGAGRPAWRALYVHALNGFYVNTLMNRLVLRFWPSGPAQDAGLHLNPLARKA